MLYHSFPKSAQTTYAKLNTPDFCYSMYINDVAKFKMNHDKYKKNSDMKY